MKATKTKRVVPIPQNDKATCWLAAYQMMFNWKGKPVDTIPKLLKAAVADDEACYKKGLDKTDWDKAAKAFGLKSVAGKSPFTAAELMDYAILSPVLIHGKFDLGMHTIVVVGCTVAESSDETEIVRYINPYWSAGAQEVFERWSNFKQYLKPAVEANKGIAGVIQYW